MFKMLIEVMVNVTFKQVHLLRCQHLLCIGHELHPDCSGVTDGIAKPCGSGHEGVPVRDIRVNLLVQTSCGICDILDGQDDPGTMIESDLHEFDFLLACKA